MVEGNEEKTVGLQAQLDQIHAITEKLSHSSNPETLQLTMLVIHVMALISGEFAKVWESTADHRTLSGELLDKHNGLVQGLLRVLIRHDLRIRELEKKPQQPNLDLDSMKADLKVQRDFINEHKETFEDVALLRQKGWQAIIKKMEERKGSKDGR